MRTSHPLRDTHHSSIHKSIHAFIHSGFPRGREGGRDHPKIHTSERSSELSCLLAFAPRAFALLFTRAARVIVAAIADRKVFLAPSRLRQWRRASARHRRNLCSIAITLHLELNRFHKQKQKQKQNRAGTETERPGLGFWSEDFGAMQLQRLHTMRKV
jgi:hypothetical protein